MKTNIIFEFLNMKKDIDEEYNKSKLPKFIKKIRYNKHRKRLLVCADKLKIANTPIDTDNLRYLFTYIFNNFPPYGSYKFITSISIKRDIIVKLTTNKKHKVSFIISPNKNVFEFKIYTPGGNYDLYLNKLSTTNELIKDEVYELNCEIWRLIREYIIETI